jgi:peptidyl-dipeptidase A
MKRFRLLLPLLVAAASLGGCSSGAQKENTDTTTAAASPRQREVQTYLDDYNRQYQDLYTRAQEAEWQSNTRIVAGDTATQNATKRANEALAVFTGSSENIGKVRSYLKEKNALTPLQVRQLEFILYLAGNNPQTVADVVKKRIDAQARQVEKLYGYAFTIDGKEVSTNDLDRILRESANPAERRKAWLASKEVGKELKDGLAELQGLRNQTVKGLGFPDFFAYQVSDYQMNSDELLGVTRQMVRDVWPLYRELHTYARYELAKKYRQPCPNCCRPTGCPTAGARTGRRW